MKKCLLLLLVLLCSMKVGADTTVKVDGIVYRLQHVVGRGTFASVYGVAMPAEERVNITIPSVITYNSKNYEVLELLDNCFGQDNVIENIDLPSSLKILNANAFYECTKLKKLTIPASVTSIVGKLCEEKSGNKNNYVNIEEYVFEDGEEPLQVDLRFNSSVKKVYLGRNIIVNPETDTFSSEYQQLFFASDVEMVIVGPTVTQLSNQIFKSCKKLSMVTFTSTNRLESIGKQAFYNCPELKLQSSSLPSTIKTIGAGAFSGCTLLQIDNLPSSLEEIGDYAFCQTAICNADFGSNLKKLGNGAFSQTGVHEAKWPVGTTVANNAYGECKSIESIVLPEGITTIDTEAFSGCISLQSIKFPCTLKVIRDRAFSYCDSLKSLTIPGYVDSIGAEFLRYTRLDQLIFENSNSDLFLSEDTRIYNVCELYIGRNLLPGTALFQYAPLNNVKIGQNLSSLPAYFTGNTSLEAIVLPPNVKNVEPEIFSGCTKLKDVTLSPNLTTLPKNMFYNCESLESLILPPNIRNISSNVFTGSGLKELHVMAARPPKAVHNPGTSESSFSQEQYRNVILHVPAESFELYDSSMPWMLFSNIVKEDYSGIDSPAVDSELTIDWDAPIEVYNISGIRVATSPESLPTGLYIVRQGSHVVKIVIN